MFFPRLRRQAKWAFVFLAVVFGVGFTAFGVGSDVPGGIADILQGGGAVTGQPSVEDARERLDKNPNDIPALRDLATALQAEGKPNEAAAALERLTALRPRDEEALRQLAVLRFTRANELRDEVQRAQIEAQIIANPADFLSTTTPLGQALSQQSLTQAIQSQIQERVTRLYTQMQTAYQQAMGAYSRLARVVPDDAGVQLQLAEAALNAGDTQAAIAGYQRFLKLAPDDPSAPLVRQQIERLRQGPSVLGG